MMTNQFQRTRIITSSPDKHYSPDSEDDFRSGCQNVSHLQQFFLELPSPARSHYTNNWYSWVQTKKFLRRHVDILVTLRQVGSTMSKRKVNILNLIIQNFTYSTCSCLKWPRPIGDSLDIPFFLRILSNEKHGKELSLGHVCGRERGDPNKDNFRCQCKTQILIIQASFMRFTEELYSGLLRPHYWGEGGWGNQSIPHPDNFAFHYQYPVVFQLQNHDQ